MEKKQYIKASVRIVNLQANDTLLAGGLGYTDCLTDADQLGKKCFIDDWDDDEDYDN